MKKGLKWTGIVLAGLIGVIVLMALVGYFVSNRRLNKRYEITVEPIPIPSDAASLEEGRRLTVIRGCGASDCHASDFSGSVLLDDPMIGLIYPPNLTLGQGSATAGYSTEDWVRSVRHGVDREGNALLIMPSSSYAGLSDEDLGRIIAYIQSRPPADHTQPESRLGPIGRVLHLTDQAPLPILSAEVINHGAQAPEQVTPEVSVDFGKYMIGVCTDCHHSDLSGGPIPGALPGEPPAADLTPAGNLGHWTYEGFANALRTGVTPDGKVLDPAVMPWPIALEMTDVEIEALWLYLQSLPPASPAG
jgi:cytochrome c553